MDPAYRPMLATLVAEAFDDKKWVFETKWDGFRLVTEKRGEDVTLWSRNGINVTTKFAALLPALRGIAGTCVIDGEICALDAQGRSRFQLLQNALNKKATLLYESGTQPLTVLTEDGKSKQPRLKGSTEATAAFTAEIQAAVDAVTAGREPDLLSATLARDALLLCHKECQSVLSGNAVTVG